MTNPTIESGIPILTEVIETSQAESAPSSAPAKQQQPPPKAPREMKAPRPQGRLDVVDEQAVDGWLNEEWDRLERKIGGRILHQVMSRLESDLENRVRDALADVLQVAVESLAVDIKQSLQHSLQDVISQAVKNELARMQATK